MRLSLENIEKIEQYLLNELPAEDRIEVDEALKNNVAFKKQFEQQRDLIKVAQRIALKKQIKEATNQISIWSKVSKWLIGGTLVFGVLLLAIFTFETNSNELSNSVADNVGDSFEHTNGSLKATENPVKWETITEQGNEIEEKDSSIVVVKTEQFNSRKTASKYNQKKNSSSSNFNGLKTWISPTEQEFMIDPKKGATIEGEQGVLVIVPSNAFLDKNNKLVIDEVTFTMVEALRLEDMVLYNLGTTSNGKALETGGMLHFYFSCKGEKSYCES